MGTLLAFLSAVSGFACLALSMARHCRDLFGKVPSRSIQRVFRIVGWVLMIISIGLTVSSEGPAIGPVLWFGLLTPAAQATVLMLTYRNRWPTK